jgi:RNA polymerase sigma factor (sigma-70 family)
MDTAANRLRSAVAHLQRALAPPEGDAQLLARFLAGRDEAAFAALVRRHGPMVLGVCRRVLRHAQDAEDAFQATFLVLARKAASVRQREALGSWLYAVAYRTARQARDTLARRRARERQVDAMPHPEVAAAEVQDWRPVLDAELSGLPEKYRSPVVLCDLEGQPRREAARQLGLPDGTLSRRLAAGRKLLAERLSRRGVVLSGGALAALLAEDAASAQVAGSLVGATAKAAALVAAGQMAAVATPVAVLTKGVLRAMFFTKLKITAGVVLLAAALGAGSLAYRSGEAQAAQAPGRAEGKPRSELETLRRENELLKLNLEVVLEKVRAQEAELRSLRKAAGGGDIATIHRLEALLRERPVELTLPGADVRLRTEGDTGQQAETALKALREAQDSAARERALEDLERALRTLREQLRRVPRSRSEQLPNQELDPLGRRPREQGK